MYLLRGVTARGCTTPGGVPAKGGGVPAKGEGYLPRHSPHVNRMTDRCKNITLPQTSFAGGKYECFSTTVFNFYDILKV